MLILDWRHPRITCASLGNVVASVLAVEYIKHNLNKDIGIIPANWYQDAYKLVIPSDRIFNDNNIPLGSEVKICYSDYNTTGRNKLPWVHGMVSNSGWIMPYEEKLNPSICWLNSSNSRRVLLYPREYNNQNVYFTMDYWVRAASMFKQNGWKIVCMMDEGPSHRDGETSLNWCNEFRNKVKCDYIFNSTLQGLQIAVGLCEISYGILSGPFWLMLKSTIKQIVISDPNDKIETHNATYNIPFIKKPLIHVPNNSLEIIKSL